MKLSFFSPSAIIFFGAIIVAFGGFLAAVQTNKFQGEITRLNNFILSSITGGDSFCYLALSSINHKTNDALILAVSQGKYPLYDVAFRIVDLDEFGKVKNNLTLDNVIKSETIINVGNMTISAGQMLRKINLGSRDEKKYNVFISARNGFTTQLIRMRRINNEWKEATIVTKRDGDKEIKLFEVIDKEFPRNNKGEVDWE